MVDLRGISIEHGPGGIDNGGTLTVEQSILSELGTGIYSTGDLTVLLTTLKDSATAINDHAGMAVVERSRMRRNDYGITSGYRLTVSQSDFIGNRIGIDNGWIADVDRSTFARNSSRGIVNWASLSLTQSTLSGNFRGGTYAIQNVDTLDPGNSVLQSTIIDNSLPSGSDCYVGDLGSSYVTSHGFNLADDGSCHLTAGSDKPNTEPLLTHLDNHGGPTRTFGLRPISPALDAGFAGDSATDQRGVPRIVDYPGVPTAPGSDGSDIGSFELQAP